MKILGNNSINVATIAEECFYPVNTSPSIYKSLDDLFKEKGVSFTGTGAQDILCGMAPVIAVGAQHTIKKIYGLIQYNIDLYGKAVCEVIGVGKTVDQFNKKTAPSTALLNLNSNDYLAAMFGWKIKETKSTLTPIVVEKDINSQSFDGVIKAGIVSGNNSHVITECENGIIIESEMITKVFHEGDEFDGISYKIFGEPNSEIVFNKPGLFENTAATTVNRLVQIVNARPGFVPTYELGIIPW
eukprot:CAMPEP_0170522664 /NCGR_PEP_ID=MMETSP0209-20121228/8093_1 /TAXON_ID=665100 ORGANISM="Litonotus pictus, Strain P1" /NCGR_SAMPLE_ID=MMETSP0209 /ASSEMBLY_ACC=CAM_ASM_000301 /LENGTH=242 /DNA_ID=CAMNT_0010810297 /DNA_START=150 /DNA_END=875 /DNA_ORIENTATION=-